MGHTFVCKIKINQNSNNVRGNTINNYNELFGSKLIKTDKVSKKKQKIL